MARISPEEVKEILDTQAGYTTLLAGIQAATLLIDQYLLTAGYGEPYLKEIERWLAAHFICIFDPRKHQEKVLDSTTTYEGHTGMGLNASTYGQQAILLDVSRTLAGLNSAEPGQQSSMEVFGG